MVNLGLGSQDGAGEKCYEQPLKSTGGTRKGSYEQSMRTRNRDRH